MRASAAISSILVVMVVAGACSPTDEIARLSSPSSVDRDGSAPGGKDDDEGPAREAPKKLHPSSWVIGPRTGRSVFLILDGAPGRRALDRVLSALEDAAAPAAFAPPGRWIKKNRRDAARIVEGGHALANRGWTHRPLTKMSRKKVRRTIRRAERALASVGADPKPFLVPPRGARNVKVLRVAGRRGYRALHATFAAPGARHKDVARMTLAATRPGAILSLDLWRTSHVRALPRILNGLKRKDLAPAPIERLRRARPVRWDVTLRPGDHNPLVRVVQSRLAAITYDPGPPDGIFGDMTLHAVRAFQRVEGLAPTDELSARHLEAIALASAPDPPAPGDRYIDIDVARQVLFEVSGGRVVTTLPVSTANGAYYRSEGELRIAHTPRGEFAIDRKIPGWRTSDLGQLYHPLYFYGGYAIHGSPSVPPYPASHGCVRIPMHAAVGFYERNAIGVPVFVHD